MLNTNNVQEFIRHNDKELRYLVSHLCMKHGLCSPAVYRIHTVNDIIQEIYLRLLTGDIIESFDVDWPTSPKISTYLYPIIRNMVRTYKKSSKVKMARGYFRTHGDDQAQQDDVDAALRCNSLSNEFQAIVDHNQSTDSIDGLGSDLDDFEQRFLSKRDKSYKLSKRKYQDTPQKKCNLSDVYKLLNEGLSNREIAEIYGVSDMWISTMKSEIKVALSRFGIVWKPQIRRRRGK